MNHNKLIAVGLILTIGVFLTAGCIGGEEGKGVGYPEKPAKVVELYVETLGSQGLEESKKYMSQSFLMEIEKFNQENLDQTKKFTEKTNIEVIETLKENIQGNKATVKIKARVTGYYGEEINETKTGEFTLTKENNKWKVKKGKGIPTNLNYYTYTPP